MTLSQASRGTLTPPPESTTCCIVGGGPAGIILAYLLARKGIAVTVLEAANDFEREFRGDTLQPAILELLDQLGLADDLLKLEHVKAPYFHYRTKSETFRAYDLTTLKTKFPYITLIRQSLFLRFMVERARAFASFNIVMGARVEELLQEGETARGVRYRKENTLYDLQATLTVAADGRFSKVRQLAQMELLELAPGTDVLWFKLPKHAGDPADSAIDLYIGERSYVAMLDRGEHWQVGYSIPKGTFKEAKAAGLESVRSFIRQWVPWLANRADFLQDWQQVTLLSVQILRCKQWYKPGLLLIGDAAHVISPVGGVGINIAVQDAVATANILTKPLLGQTLSVNDLSRVQRRREWQVAVAQRQQVATEKELMKAFAAGRGSRVPPVLKFLRSLPVLKDLPGRLISYGLRPERLEQ
jgi:2-polyprenyl-6-methoxyphenol hydroxylase-like FAD-dependent oxidoreductase